MSLATRDTLQRLGTASLITLALFLTQYLTLTKNNSLDVSTEQEQPQIFVVHPSR